mgnify:CR=1 FL=1
MYDRILLPTDGSDGTEQALSHAVEIAEGRDATIHALSVVDRRLYLAADEAQKPELKASLGYAAETPVDLVVMGTHGRSGRDKLTNLGSVTERVVENSETPILVVRIDEREE